jgi:hypothetical protein
MSERAAANGLITHLSDGLCFLYVYVADRDVTLGDNKLRDINNPLRWPAFDDAHCARTHTQGNSLELSRETWKNKLALGGSVQFIISEHTIIYFNHQRDLFRPAPDDITAREIKLEQTSLIIYPPRSWCATGAKCGCVCAHLIYRQIACSASDNLLVMLH